MVQPESEDAGRVGDDEGSFSLARVADEAVAWLKTLASAAVYATLIVTFGFQVARVEGHSMAPTLADQGSPDRQQGGIHIVGWRAACRRHRHAVLPEQAGEGVRQARDREGRRYGANRRRQGVSQRRR